MLHAGIRAMNKMSGYPVAWGGIGLALSYSFLG